MTPERNFETVLIMENLDNREIEHMINKIRKGEKVIQQKGETEKTEHKIYEFEPETKEIKEEVLRKIHQIKYIKIEETEKLCKIRSDKKVKILIYRTKIATKEILCEYEEVLETMNEDIYERSYVVKEKPNGKSKKFTNRRVNKKPRWKEKLDKEINELTGEVSILDELIRTKKKHKMKKLDDLTPLQETLK